VPRNPLPGAAGRALRALPRAAIAWPRTVLAVFGALTAMGALGVPRLELRTDGAALVPPGDPVVRFDAGVRERFGVRDPVIVWIETDHPDGIFNAATLRSIETLSADLAGLDGVGAAHVTSLASEARPRVFPGTLRFRRLLDPFPDTPERMGWLRDDIDAIGLLDGTVVSRDRRATAILVGAAPTRDRSALHREIGAIAERGKAAQDRVAVVGAPVAEALLGAHLLTDLARLVPVSLAVIAGVLWLACRRAAGVGLALAEVGGCLLFTFGCMGWSGTPVYLTTAVLPVILTTIGIADEVHLFWHLQRNLAEGPAVPEPAALRHTLDELALPVTLTSLTTAAGFLSFFGTPIAPVASFGVFAATGIAYCWLCSLCAIPAALALLGDARIARPRHGGHAGAGLARALAPALRAPGATLAALAAVTLALGAGIPLLQVQDGWIDGFAEGSGFRRDTQRVEAGLDGTHQLWIELEFPGDQPLTRPESLRAVGDLEDFLRGQPQVGGVLGAASHVAAVNHLFLAQRPGSRRIPGDARAVDLVLRRFAEARGTHRLSELIDAARRRTLVSVFLPRANYRDTAALLAALDAYAQQQLAPHGVRFAVAGDVAVSQAMIPAIVMTQLGSVALAFVSALALLSLQQGSLRRGALAVAPTALAVVWVSGWMGWRAIPIGVATSTFCAVVFGIGVDYAIHFLARLRLAADAFPRDRALRAVREAGPAIAGDACAVAAGFGVLGLSQVPANARLGLLVAASLASSALLTLVGLAAFWIRNEARHGEGAHPAGDTGNR
jgi:hypothetical protein